MKEKIVSGLLQQHCLEALGPPGGGLGCHRGSKAREILRAAHVRGLEEETPFSTIQLPQLITFINKHLYLYYKFQGMFTNANQRSLSY